MSKGTAPKEQTTLGINEDGELAFFYIGHLPKTPDWATIDVGQAHIVIGAEEELIGGIVMDQIDKNLYEDIHNATYIYLVGVDDTPDRNTIEAYKVPLTVATQL